MTRFLNSYVSKSMRPEPYEITYGEEDDDFDEDFDDDAYYGLSDYEDDDDSPGHGRSGRHSAAVDEDVDGIGGESRRQRSMSEGSTGQLEGGDDNRRDHHNQLERKRRASIKTSYNDLREVIPSLRGSKASRVVILQRAVEYIEQLADRNSKHNHCVETLRRNNDALDLRVQELQRCIDRADEEDISSSMCSTSNGILRLYSGSITASGSTAPRSSSVPVYRLLPQDSLERVSSTHGMQSNYVSQPANSNQETPHASTLIQSSSITSTNLMPRTRTNSVMHVITGGNSSTSTLNGMNALSAAVSLVASSNSAFSCTSSSSSSNIEPTQSSSQRSSPGCLSSSSTSSCSSSSSSSSSSSNASQHSLHQKRELGEERSLIMNVSPTADIEPQSTIATTTTTALLQCTRPKALSTNAVHANQVVLRPSSPPSILLNVPIRTSATASANTALGRIRQRQLVTSESDSSATNELLKRRRLI